MHNRRCLRLIVPISAAGALLIVADAHANGGSGMMISRSMHLMFGNALFGLIEGFLIAWLFRQPFARAIGIMILANYLSAFVGCGTLVYSASLHTRSLLDEVSLYDAWPALQRILLAYVAVAFILTIIIEWPFCAWAIKEGGRRFHRGLIACLIVQPVTYAVLLLLGNAASSYSLFTEATLDPNVVADAADDAAIYFVDTKDSTLCRINLNGTDRETIPGVDALQPYPSLSICRQTTDAPWQLVQRQGKDQHTLVEDVALKIVPRSDYHLRPFADDWPDSGELLHLMSFWAYRPPLDFRPDDQRQWSVNVFHWQGLIVRNTETSEEYRLAYDTALTTWAANSGTLIPGNRLIFGMGGRILLLELETKRLGVITRGTDPIVVPHRACIKPPPRPATRPASENALLPI